MPRSGLQPVNRQASAKGSSPRYSPYSAYAVQVSNPTQDMQIDSSQVKNSDGAYVWQVDDMMRLKRFLVLGSDGGTYYISERKLTQENGECVRKMLMAGRGKEIVDVVRQYSVEGRTFKQDPLIFTLAMCARLGDPETKKAAYGAIEEVLRIPTHLFTFIEFCELLSPGSKGGGTGWGRAHRRAISNWYNNKQVKNLVYLMTKYQSRNGWSHHNVLQLAHPNPKDLPTHGLIYKYVAKKTLPTPEEEAELMEEYQLQTIGFLRAFENMKTETDEQRAVEMIRQWNFAREHIPTNLLNSYVVWAELLQKMPLTAMIRNLGKMTTIGLLSSNNSTHTDLVVNNLTNEEYLHKSRVHPLAILIALKTYAKGSGVKGSLTWSPIRRVVDALDSAFYKAFKNVEPTGKRFLLALDVSPSMTGAMCGNGMLSANEAATALSMVTAATEPKCDIMGFDSKFRALDVSPRRRLDDNMKATVSYRFGGTDCSLPMTWALEKRNEYDVFIVYTDSETNTYGSPQAASALRRYRREMKNPHAKLIVMGMTSNGFTLADPNDPGMLDVVGFDTSVPGVIREFVSN